MEKFTSGTIQKKGVKLVHLMNKLNKENPTLEQEVGVNNPRGATLMSLVTFN